MRINWNLNPSHLPHIERTWSRKSLFYARSSKNRMNILEHRNNDGSHTPQHICLSLPSRKKNFIYIWSTYFVFLSRSTHHRVSFGTSWINTWVGSMSHYTIALFHITSDTLFIYTHFTLFISLSWAISLSLRIKFVSLSLLLRHLLNAFPESKFIFVKKTS